VASLIKLFWARKFDRFYNSSEASDNASNSSYLLLCIGWFTHLSKCGKNGISQEVLRGGQQQLVLLMQDSRSIFDLGR